MGRIILTIALLLSATASARAEGEIEQPTAPTGSELERTTSDPGWWQRTFVGWDANGDDKYTGGERGILIIAWDAIMGLFVGLGEGMLKLALTAIPEQWKPDTTEMVQYVKIANTWLPLDMMLGLFFSYYTFLSSYVAFRWAFRCIPFLGG